MLFVSFDTTGRELTVSLLEDGQILQEERIDFGALAADDPRLPLSGVSADGAKKANRQESVSLLLPTIDGLLKTTSKKKSDISCIAVGVGPGGFTGIRVAITTARTIAQALNLPLIGLNSLELAAASVLAGAGENEDAGLSGASSAAGSCGIIKVASRTHCYMAVYRKAESDVEELTAPSYFTYEVMAEKLDLAERWHFEEAVLERIAGLKERGEILAPIRNIASLQAKIAWLRVSLKGISSDAFNYRLCEPLYLRGASVTLKKGDAIERVESS